MKKTLFFLMLSIPVFSHGQGIISTFAGNGTAAYSGDGGMATAAAINNPVGIVFDTAGNAYISDRLNNRIRVVSPSGIINTFAGNGTAGYSGDGGSALSAEFTIPNNLAIDRQGNIYIADYGNDVIRKVSTSGIITTIAGTGGVPGYGGDGGPATAAYLHYPSAMAVDTFGNIYIADYANATIREVNTTGIISTIAGTGGTSGSSGDGGPAISALLNGPFGVCLDDTGNIYIGDAANNKVRKISAATGIITTFAGTGTPGFSGDAGPAVAAQLHNPPGVVADHFGNIFIADQFNNRIRQVSSDGTITTIIGNGTAGFSGDGGPAILAEINDANAVGIGPSGNVFVCDNNNNRIREYANCVNAITLNPVSDTVIVGDTAIFTVTTSAVSPVYQWQENPGTGFVNLANVLPYSGVNTNTLSIYNPSALLDTTQYRCVVSSSSSCPDTSSFAILVIESGAGITPVSSMASLNIFPNPAHDDITIQLPGQVNNGNIQLLDELGQLISEKNISGNTVNFSLGNLPCAIYMLKISANGWVVYRKLIKN